ncbi:hypothetical protein MTO96_032007 [Rhipicephalus appendiculatus]
MQLHDQQQAKLVVDVADKELDLAGDGRCDSPGHSTKYLTYTVFETKTNRILHCEQVQVGEVHRSSNQDQLLKGQLIYKVYIHLTYVYVLPCFADPHPGVRAFLRKKKLRHFYDAWHIAKAGNGDGDLIVSMWRSMLNHICNRHVGHQGPFTACLHGPLEDREWMKRDSLAFCKMRAILECPRLFNDLRQLSPDAQTFSLEAFNSLLIRFAPKSTVFSPCGMKARTRLAVLHFNENAVQNASL